MSGRGRQIKIEILGDARDAQKTFDALEKSSSGLGDKLKSVASIAGGFILAQGLMRLPDLLRSTSDQAARLESEGRKSAVVFGESLGIVQQWAEESAAGMGLTRHEATALAAGMGDLLVPMGFTRDAAAEMSTQTLELAGALSEWSGGQRTAAEVSEILTKAMLGERESLKELGISINQAEVDQRVLENAQQGVTFETEQQAAAFATQQLIMEKSQDAQTAYAESTDDLASRQARLTARQAETREALVRFLTPAIIAGQEALLNVADAILVHVEPALERLSENLRIIWGWFNQQVIPAIEDAIDVFEDFLEPLEAVADEVQEFIDSLADGVSVQDLARGFSGIGGAIVGAVSTSLDSVDWSDVRGKIAGGLSVGFAFGSDKAQALVDGLSGAFDSVDWSAVRAKVSDGLFGGITAAEGVGQRIADTISTQFDAVDWSAVQTSVRDGIMGGLGAASEGADATSGAGQKIQDWLTSEVDALEDWSTLGHAVRSGLISGLAVASGGAAIAVTLIDWIATQLLNENGDWAAVANNIATKIGEAFGEALSIGEDLVDWISESLQDVDWQATADSVASGLASSLSAVDTVAQAIADGIREHIGSVDWSGTDWESATGSMTETLGSSLQASFVDAFGDIDFQKAVEDAGLVLTPEALFGDGGLMETLGALNDELADIARVLEEELGPTIDDAKDAWAEWEPILRPLFGLIADLNLAALSLAISGLLQPLKLAAEALQIFFDWTQIVLDGLALLGGQITDFGKTSMTIVTWSMTSVQAMNTWADDSAGAARRFLDGVLGPVDEMVMRGADAIRRFTGDGVTTIDRFASESRSALQAWTVDTLRDLGSWVADAAGVVAQLPGLAVAAVGALGSALYQAGRDLIQGFVNGIRSMAESAAEAARSVGQGAIDAVTGVLGISSPSKVFHAFGVDTVQGLINGIDYSLPAVQASARNLGTQIIQAMEEGLDEGARRSGALATDAKPYPVGHATGRAHAMGIADGVADGVPNAREAGAMVGAAVAEGYRDAIVGAEIPFDKAFVSNPIDLVDPTEWNQGGVLDPSGPLPDRSDPKTVTETSPSGANDPEPGALTPEQQALIQGDSNVTAVSSGGGGAVGVGGGQSAAADHNEHSGRANTFRWIWWSGMGPDAGLWGWGDTVETAWSAYSARWLADGRYRILTGNLSISAQQSAGASMQPIAGGMRQDDIYGGAGVGSAAGSQPGLSGLPGAIQAGYGSISAGPAGSGGTANRASGVLGGSPNITINIESRSTNPQEIANEVEQAMRFAALDPALAQMRTG